jgi:hypothetical protein
MERMSIGRPLAQRYGGKCFRVFEQALIFSGQRCELTRITADVRVQPPCGKTKRGLEIVFRTWKREREEIHKRCRVHI